MMNNMEQDDGFCIKVYSPGNFIAKEITINGGVHLGTNTAAGGFTDEQIAKALSACVGKGKVIDNKQKLQYNTDTRKGRRVNNKHAGGCSDISERR